MRTTFLLAPLLLLEQYAGAVSITTKQICVTKSTSPSPRGPVTTRSLLHTNRRTQIVVITKTPEFTITPRAITSTSTVTSTITIESDVPQVTDTFTSTVISTSTSTLTLPTLTITNTNTATSTTLEIVLATTTLAPPDGFRPVLDTFPNAAAKKRFVHDASSPRPDSLLDNRMVSQAQPLCPGRGKSPRPGWPAAVTCFGIVESFALSTITRTAKKTTTVTAPTPTSTVYTTLKETSVTIVTTPDASTTIMVTSAEVQTATESPTTTTATTTTITVTVQTYAATAYAQCASGSRNFAGTLSGHAIDSTFDNNSPPGFVGAINTADTNAQACCNSCAANPLCGGSSFYGGFQTGKQCYNFIVSDPTCSVGQDSLGAFYVPNTSPDSGYSVSNGKCGVYNVNGGPSQ